jgi:hypothetical protein
VALIMLRRLFLAALLASTVVPRATREADMWRVRLTEGGGTDLTMRMTLRVDGDRWELYSRPGGVNAFLNWRQRLMGRALGKLPPEGALVYGSGPATPSGDSLVLRGAIRSELLGKRLVRGSLNGGRLSCDLAWANDSNSVAGHFDGIPDTSQAPIRDYPAIAARTRDSIRALIYDPSIADRPNMLEFFERLEAAAREARDDLDMTAAFAAAQPLIGITHFGFIRNPKIAATPIDSLVAGDPTTDVARFVNFGLWGNGEVAYLRVSHWDRATPFIQRAFERMDSAHTSVLVLDITMNGGGDATSLTPAMHLFRDTMGAGVVVGRPWYATHRKPPTAAEAINASIMENEEAAKSLLTIVTRDGVGRGRVAPRAPYFAGKVYVLADARTGSASEPLAYLLKASGRATLVGTRTAGAMLTALPHPVGDGFIVTVPEADYYTEDGVRLEGKGVEPHIVSDDPNVTVDREIRKTLPYPALSMLGQIAFNRRQFEAAERHWTEALGFAVTDANRRWTEQRIARARQARQAR